LRTETHQGLGAAVLDNQRAWAKSFLTDDPKERLAATAPRPTSCSEKSCAARGDAASAADVRGICGLFLKGGMSVDIRREILRHARAFQQEPNLPVSVYQPFMCDDPDIGVCCTAVIDWVSEMTGTAGRQKSPALLRLVAI
jgi:hypothetical protein